MSDLAFHTGIADRFLYVCKGLKKAQRLGMSAAVLLETTEDLNRLDALLWSFEQTGFIPHAVPGTPEFQRGAFALSSRAADLPNAELLFMLTNHAPKDIQGLMERFPKIIDVVSSTDPELTEGRDRFRSYRRQGVTPNVVNPAAR